MPRMIGTILPTAESLSATARWAAKRDAQNEQTAKRLFAGMTARRVGGETRYYKTATVYAIISARDGQPRWFEQRADGDYPINHLTETTAQR